MRAAKKSGAETVIVPDSGFAEKAEHVGPANMRLIRLHRNGLTFAGDSRGCIGLDRIGVHAKDVRNDGTLAHLRHELECAIR